MIELLPPELGPLTGLALLGISFLGSFITVAFGFERMAQVCTHAACMTSQHGLKVVAFGILGVAFGPYTPLVVGMIVVGFAGTVVGRKVLMKIDEKRIKLALNGILILLCFGPSGPVHQTTCR